MTPTGDTGPELRDTRSPGRWAVSDVVEIGSGEALFNLVLEFAGTGLAVAGLVRSAGKLL